MTAIQGFADLLLDDGLNPSDRLNNVQVIRRNSEHLLSILNDILDLSKIEAGQMSLETIAVSPSQVVTEVASLMRVRALEKKLHFEVRYMDPIPEQIQSDPTRLRQVLMNLVGNGIKFTSSGSVMVLVRFKRERPELVFEVVDTGIGIPQESMDKLFKPFSQADTSTTRRFGGTGLGLAISHRMAGMLGGNLEVDSHPGRGSTFILTVATGPIAADAPLIAGLTEAIHAVEEAQVEAAAPAGELVARVLLAEDGVDNQKLISTYLIKAGCEVVVAENGRIAVERVLEARDAGRPFDLVLMDMQMPELDGYGATARLRSKQYTGPIVALTAHAMAGDREACLAAGCDDYMTKPIRRDVLLAAVQKVTGPGMQRPAVQTLRSAFADDPDMQDILAEFVHSLTDRAIAVRNAAGQGKWEELKRLAHQLKGAGGGYGFPDISSAAGRVERASTEDPTELAESVDALCNICGRASAARRAA